MDPAMPGTENPIPGHGLAVGRNRLASACPLLLLAGILAGWAGLAVAEESTRAAPQTQGTSSGTPQAPGEASPETPLTEVVQVTATRIPESPDALPGSLTVVTGEDLLRRGARDLPSALALLAGVSIAPGGDSGPAGSVPELMGLREFDAFLLTVDGVPWGGAFIPSLATLDLKNVDRIEVLRGPAPVMYGATSFVGVINVIRKTPGEGGVSALASAGSYGSALAGVDSALPSRGALHSSVEAELSTRGFRDERTEVDRGLLRWRGLLAAGGGFFRINGGGIWQRQDPASPRVREGADLSPLVPVDSNNNPLGSHLDENRYVAGGTYERPLPAGNWSTTLSFTRSDQNILRGFLTDLAAPVDNASGYRREVSLTEIYFDGHVELSPRKGLQVVAGLDHLHGAGNAEGGDFDYTVGLDGSHPPDGTGIPSAGEASISDHREFSGLYGQAFWDPRERWHLEAGVRLNRTTESRSTREVELSTSTATTGQDSRSELRGGGMAGVTFTAWRRGPEDLRLFADYRNTYKPAVVDFGPEAEPEILAPETGESYEAGLKGRLAGGRAHFTLSVFRMDLRNIVVSRSVGGLPALESAGEERLRGIEAEGRFRLARDLDLSAGYSLHDARFGDYVTDFGGVPTQLEGNRIEMSARHMGSLGISHGRAEGWQAYGQGNYVGSRYLNKRNTAPADAYTTWDAGIAYRFHEYEIRLDGRNLNDGRPPVAESELGDAQYYLLQPRRIEISLRWLSLPKKAAPATVPRTPPSNS